MPEASNEAFEMLETDETIAQQPDLAASLIQKDEGKKLQSVLAQMEGGAM